MSRYCCFVTNAGINIDQVNTDIIFFIIAVDTYDEYRFDEDDGCDESAVEPKKKKGNGQLCS